MEKRSTEHTGMARGRYNDDVTGRPEVAYSDQEGTEGSSVPAALVIDVGEVRVVDGTDPADEDDVWRTPSRCSKYTLHV